MSEARSGLSWVDRLKSIKLFGFGVVAGIGWLLDFCVFALLVILTGRPMLSNMVGASLGVTFAYFMSARSVFYYEGGFLFAKFLVYFVYNAASILLFSFFIAELTLILGVHPTLAKIFVTPFTFYTNFLFMNVLLTGHVKLY
jgi:putative flippase GtrA